MSNTTISASYANLVGVVVRLLRVIEKQRDLGPNEVKAPDRENGLAATVVMLCAAIIEGSVHRRYHFEELAGSVSPDQRKSRERLLQWLEPHLASSAVDVRHVEEVFSARDMLVHAHTWVAKTDGLPTLHFVEPPTLAGYGDPRFRRILDEKTRKSTDLRLNLYPIRVWRRDAYECFRVAISVLAALEASDPIGLTLRSNSEEYWYRGSHRTLPEIMGMLPVIEDR